VDFTVAGAFIDGAANPRYADRRVLGVRLRKFSLWHRFLLNTIESPFMSKGTVTMFDLRVAVGVCRLEPFDSNVHKPWLVPLLIFIGAFLRSFFPRPRHSGPGQPLNARQRALVKRCDMFFAYCQEYIQAPEYTIIPIPKGKNHVPQTPRGRFDDCIEHVGELITWGIPEREAWSMPLGRANVYRILARRAAGNDVDIVTEEERQFQEEMRRHAAAGDKIA
jgi:hypothetical protein